MTAGSEKAAPMSDTLTVEEQNGLENLAAFADENNAGFVHVDIDLYKRLLAAAREWVAAREEDVTPEAVAALQAKADPILAQDEWEQISPSPNAAEELARRQETHALFLEQIGWDATLSRETAALLRKLSDENDKLVLAIGDHVTVRGEYYDKIRKLEERIREWEREGAFLASLAPGCMSSWTKFMPKRR